MECSDKTNVDTPQLINSGVNKEHLNTYRDASITKDTQDSLIERIKTNTSWNEGDNRPSSGPQVMHGVLDDKGKPLNDPQAMCEVEADKSPLNQFAHKKPLEQMPYCQEEMFTQGKSMGIKDQLLHKPSAREELNTPLPPIHHDSFIDPIKVI